MSERTIRVVVADDHPIVRKGVRAVLEAESDIKVVGEAGDGTQALALARSLKPDIMLLDVSMPGMTGMEVTRIVHGEFPDMRVILLTMHEGEEYFFQALTVGASGYLIKGAGSEEILAAVRSLGTGGIYLHPTVARKLVTDYLRTKAASAYDGLTAREGEVLQLIAEGLSNRQIADKLCVSITTVQTHRAHVMEKLNLHSQAELIKYAIRKGILKPA